jgi:hypothetical protein
VKNKSLVIAVVCVICVGIVALAWYQSLPPPNRSRTTNWVEYVLTKNGNHTQLQASYSNGVVTGQQQLYWLDFDNKTTVHNYFECTPSMSGCTLDGCPFTVLNDSVSEYRVKVVCGPIPQ